MKLSPKLFLIVLSACVMLLPALFSASASATTVPVVPADDARISPGAAIHFEIPLGTPGASGIVVDIATDITTKGVLIESSKVASVALTESTTVPGTYVGDVPACTDPAGCWNSNETFFFWQARGTAGLIGDPHVFYNFPPIEVTIKSSKALLSGFLEGAFKAKKVKFKCKQANSGKVTCSANWKRKGKKIHKRLSVTPTADQWFFITVL